MPCYDIRDDYDRTHNNVAAQLLCELLKTLDPALIEQSPHLAAWWKDHQDRDAMYARMSSDRRSLG